MIKRFKRAGLTLITGLLLFAPAFVPAIANAETPTNVQSICDGVDKTQPVPTGCEEPDTTLDNIISNIINTLSWIVGIVAVIMVMIGGFKFVTSGGDSNRVAESRNTIIYALVGLVIVALAQVIVRFVLDRVG